MSENPNTPSEPEKGWNTDPFPSLRTMPKGWDMSELTAPATPPANGSNGARPAASPPENGNGYVPEKFSNPRTMPKGWDMSELMGLNPTSSKSDGRK